MAHELSIQNGQAEMVSGAGITPWHKLGTVVSGYLTAREALQAAHLDWAVAAKPLFVDGVQLPFPTADKSTEGTFQAICREDNGACLGISKGRYEIIQNVEAFDFFDKLVGRGEAAYETAGALRGGRQIWLMAKINGTVLLNGDEHNQHALLVSSHDGSYSLMVQYVFERVVCANTLNIALRGAKNQLKIRHSKNWAAKEAQAATALGVGQNYFKTVQEEIALLGDALLSKDEMTAFTEALIPASDPKEVSTRTKNIRDEVNALFQRGAGNNGATRWDALNAVTDYVDHRQSTRGQNSTRLETSILGAGAALKQKAYDMLQDDSFMTILLSKRDHVSTTGANLGGGADFAALLAK
jgi:phage/plasmid-like protein (TIGR03299 family)